MKRKILFNALILLCYFPSIIQAQNQSERLFNKMNGHWQGAFIKDNSFQKLDIRFYESNGKYGSLQIIEEWHPQFGEFVIPVEIDSIGQIEFNTGYGKAKMLLDSNSLEMHGQIGDSNDVTYVHLKKTTAPPKKTYQTKEVFVQNDSIRLYGHVHEPKSKSSTAVIIVGGRSCYAGSTEYELYAKLLRSYGITVLAYNKRGTGQSTGDCSTATVSDLASDVVACKNYLQEQYKELKNIGVLGSSAGGWVMTKAEEKADFDFMISIVGPATSVRDQQLQSMDYGLDFYDLTEKAKIDLLKYTKLMFDAKAKTSSYHQFMELLKSAKKEGWYELLDDTDIPKSAEDIDNLWVRRHNFDPAGTLSSYEQPFLAIYGEIDWIVPYRENVEKLKNFFNGERSRLLDIVVAHDAEHGTETTAKTIQLNDNSTYWRFYRISPIVQISIIDFLRKHEFIE